MRGKVCASRGAAPATAAFLNSGRAAPYPQPTWRVGQGKQAVQAHGQDVNGRLLCGQ